MNVNDFVGSDTMKASDLGQTTPQVVISKVEPVTFQDGSSKLIIHPTDPNMKPVVLNVTNTRACVAAWGPESDAWIGKTVMLSVRQTQMGPGIGVTPIGAAPPMDPPGANQGSFTPGAFQDQGPQGDYQRTENPAAGMPPIWPGQNQG